SSGSRRARRSARSPAPGRRNRRAGLRIISRPLSDHLLFFWIHFTAGYRRDSFFFGGLIPAHRGDRLLHARVGAVEDELRVEREAEDAEDQRRQDDAVAEADLPRGDAV